MTAKIIKSSIKGEMTVPSSKSHTIRAVTIAIMAKGKSIIRNPSNSRDCKAALEAAKLFGVKYIIEENKWILEGSSTGIKVPDNIIDVDNSGTTLYFMTAVASLLPDWTVFTGDSSIRSRPITPLLEALEKLGAIAMTTRSNINSPPAIIKGPVHSNTVKVKGNPSQYISSLLLISPMLEGTTIIETDDPKETPYIDMTVDWMRKTGIIVNYDEIGHKHFEVTGKQSYNPFDMTISSDWSGVAFPLVAGLTTESELVINNLDFDDKQGDSKIVEFLQNMGADIKVDIPNNRLKVKGGNELRGISIDCSNNPDTVPILSVVGCIAKGVTTLENVAGVRAKETDRIFVMEEALTKMGAKIETEHNKMTIYGGKPLKGGLLDSYNDHRIAMALSIAGLFAEGETIVKNPECVSVSFPNFYEKMNHIGAGFVIE